MFYQTTGEKDYGNWLLNLTGGFNGAWDYPVHAVQSPIDGRHYLFATEDEAFNANMEDFNPKDRLTYEAIQSLYMITDVLGGAGMANAGQRIQRLPTVTVSAKSYSSTLSELASNAASNVSRKGLVKSTWGTKVHTEWARQIKESGLKNISTEVSNKNGKIVQHGTKGSIRLDTVVGDINNPQQVFDLKTGKAGLTDKRISQIRKHLPEGSKNITIEEIRPN